MVARVMAAPRPDDVFSLVGGALGFPGFDSKGRLIYRTTGLQFNRRGRAAAAVAAEMVAPAADLPRQRAARALRSGLAQARHGGVHQGRRAEASTSVEVDGRRQISMVVNPMPEVDDWAVLSDGTHRDRAQGLPRRLHRRRRARRPARRNPVRLAAAHRLGEDRGDRLRRGRRWSAAGPALDAGSSAAARAVAADGGGGFGGGFGGGRWRWRRLRRRARGGGGGGDGPPPPRRDAATGGAAARRGCGGCGGCSRRRRRQSPGRRPRLRTAGQLRRRRTSCRTIGPRSPTAPFARTPTGSSGCASSRRSRSAAGPSTTSSTGAASSSIA